MLQTAYGSLTVGLDARPGQTLLIRGGTSSVGHGRRRARQAARADRARHHPRPGQGRRARAASASTTCSSTTATSPPRSARSCPDGVDAALELVGTPTLPDTLRATRVHGVVCFTGMLSNQWTVPDFYPIDYLPRGVRLTAYGGDAADLPADVLQGFLDDVAAGRAVVPLGRTYDLDEIVEAHADHGARQRRRQARRHPLTS